MKLNYSRVALFIWIFGMNIIKSYSQESPRPGYHFTAPQYWINDPNGLIYYKGHYHLFYQHNPFENKWGHMTWGHAKSKDLIHWEHLPVAIPEQKEYMIFSGSVVHDEKNTSGLGRGKIGPLIALFTAHRPTNQSQYLAYSLDDGVHWNFYHTNPVLDLNKKDFRDPNVFWHPGTARWIMSVVLPNEFKVQFYSSENLISWEFLSEFGGHASMNRIWECPALIKLPVTNKANSFKWVLLISENKEYSSMRYFTGEFDGKHFTCDHPVDQVNPVDFGKDYYAAIPFNQAPKQKNILLGWMNNWAYANENPTTGWKGMMTIPREIKLYQQSNGTYQLIHKPFLQINKLKGKSLEISKTLTSKNEWVINSPATGLDFELESVKGVSLEFDFGNEIKLILNWDAELQKLCLDRTHTSLQFHPTFASIECAPIQSRNRLDLKIYLDRYSIEIFADEGRATISSVFFAPKRLQKIKLSGVDISMKGKF